MSDSPTRTISPLRVCGARVLCKLLKSPPKQGSIYLPTQHHTSKARVLAVGPDFPSALSPGDLVIYEKHGGIPITHEGESYTLFTVDELLGKVEA